jgi:hypothetical protein
MNRNPVRSSNIQSIGYDSDAKILEVEFHGGGIYKYSNVPETIFQGFMRAHSKGTYLHDRIRDKYPCKKIR